MAKKIKILFDGQLLVKFILQKQTGIFRVCDEFFKGLAKRDDVDLYLLVTNGHKGHPKEYLESRGLSHLIPNIVRMPKLSMSSKTRNLYHKIYGGFLRKILPFVYGKKLREFDFYFSPYPSISPIVKKSGLKTAAFIHDIIPALYPVFTSCYKGSFKRFLTYINNLDSDIVFFNSRVSRDDFLRYRFPFDFSKTAIAYLSADDRFCKKDLKEIKSVSDKYGIPHKPYLFCLSEQNQRKNFAHVLKSFIAYIEKTGDKDLHLVIAGKKLPGYDFLSECSDKSEKYKDRIILTGYVEDEDLPALYSGTSIFMYPSLYEGFGLPVLEAMKCGVPVITADNSSLLEVGGDAVAYISGFDVNETVLMIEKVLNDKKFADALVKKSAERVKLFSWDKAVDVIVTSMKKVD